MWRVQSGNRFRFWPGNASIFGSLDTAGGQIVQGFPWRGEFWSDMALHEDGLTCLATCTVFHG